MRPLVPVLAPLTLVLASAPLGCRNPAQPSESSAAPLASASAAPSAKAPTGLRVTRQLPARGSRRHDVATRWMRFDPPSPKGLSLTIEERMERELEVLEATTEAVTKVKIHYGKVTRTTTEGDGPAQPHPDPRSELVFVVSQELGQISVADANGKPASDEVAAAITADHVALGLPFPLPSLLPETPITVGDDFDLSHDAVLALFPIDADGDFDVTRVHLVYRGTPKPTTGTLEFSLETRFWGVHDGRRIELDLKGPLTARAPTAWPVRVALAGPAKLLAKSGDSPAAARPGRAQLELVSEYR